MLLLFLTIFTAFSFFILYHPVCLSLFLFSHVQLFEHFYFYFTRMTVWQLDKPVAHSILTADYFRFDNFLSFSNLFDSLFFLRNFLYFATMNYIKNLIAMFLLSFNRSRSHIHSNKFLLWPVISTRFAYMNVWARYFYFVVPENSADDANLNLNDVRFSLG